jgi:hypothetical protein
MHEGQCHSIKSAQSSLYKHKSGECYKKVAGASGSGQASTSGSNNNAQGRTARVRSRSYDEIVNEIVERAYEDFVSDLVARSDTGT